MLVNGQAQDTLELSDRALHYGDGAFETLRVEDGRPAHWRRHLSRLSKTCDFLKIPLDIKSLEHEVKVLLMDAKDTCILKIIVSRGSGGRGYRPPEMSQARRILSLHPLPSDYAGLQHVGVRLMRCQHPASENPALAGIKHLNRLDQVLASMELSADCQEGLMLTAGGKLVEGTRSNVFLVREGRLLTPLLVSAGVAGIKREIILECSAANGIDVDIRHIDIDELQKADEIFVCNSVMGIWPVIEWRDGNERRTLHPGPLTRLVQGLTKDSH
jgi:4-amino-4-deoxychorismate lyase